MSERADMGVMGSFCAQNAPALPGSARQSAEIAALFDDTILDVRYLSSRNGREKIAPAYTIGSQASASFHLQSRCADVAPFALVRAMGAAHELCFTDEMRGDVRIGADTLTLAQLQMHARSAAGTFAWTIPAGARCRVMLGNNEFFVRMVDALERQPMPLRIDWREQIYFAGVLAAAVLLLVLAWATPPTAHSLSVDAFLDDPRFLNIVVKPPAEELLAQLQNGAAQNAGGAARHDGPSGEMGNPNVLKAHARYTQKGPKDNPDPKLAHARAIDAAKNSGILGLLAMSENSMIGGAASDEHALGRDSQNILGNLTGNDVGPANGYADALGDHGHDRGGGGNSPDTIGVAPLGRIGDGPGGPGSSGGRTPGITSLVGRRAQAPEPHVGPVEVRGSLDKELIRRVVRQHMNEIKFCYEQELVKNSALYGRVLIGFTISSEGRVIGSTIEKSTLGSAIAESCMTQTVARWEFPKPQGGVVTVSYPFVLQAAGQ